MRRINHSSRFIEECYSRYPKQKLGGHISVIRGVSYKPSDVRSSVDEGVAIILRSNNIADGEINFDDLVYVVQERVQNEQKLKPGDIVMCGSNGSIGLVGKAGLLKDNMPNTAFGAFCLGIKCKETILPEYLNTYFNTQVYRNEIESMGNGTNIINIRPDNITNLSIPIPPVEKQMAFVEVVNQADKSKFSDFKSRFIEMFGNAEKTMPLSDCIGITFPGEWGEDDSDGTGVKVIRTTNFTNSGKLDLTNVVTRKIDPAKIDKKHLIPGDIILERSGGTADNPVGRVVYFEAKGTFLFNNFTQLLRCKDGVNSLFVFYSLYNYYHTHKSEIRSLGNKTTGIQNLKMDKYWDIPIADASHEQQDQFVSLYKQADKSKYLN